MNITPLTMVAALRLIGSHGPEDRSARQIALAIGAPHLSDVSAAMRTAHGWGWVDKCEQTRTYTITARGLARLHQEMRSETVRAAARLRRKAEFKARNVLLIDATPATESEIISRRNERRNSVIDLLFQRGKMRAVDIATELRPHNDQHRNFSFECLGPDIEAGTIATALEPMLSSAGVIRKQRTYDLTLAGRRAVRKAMKVKA